MKKSVLISVILVAATVAMSSCIKQKKAVETASDKVLVRTMEAVTEPVEQIANFTSDVKAFNENNICPSVAVRINKILVDVGARVSKGQLLVVMDPTQYNQAAVQLANLETDHQRLKTVYDAGGVSKQQLDQLATQLQVQKDAVKNLKENIELRSPIDGVITGRYYDPGDLFSMSPNESGSASVLQVMQINNVKVKVNVSEQYFPQVKLGMPVDISVDLFPDKEFKGKVSLIYPSIEPSTRTFAVEITIPNANGILRPGMFSRTTLNFGKKDGILVDDLAVQKQIGTNEKFVYVIKDGVAERRIVNAGRQVGKRVNIISGVSVGEQVAVAGLSRLTDKCEVEVKNN